MQTEDDTCRTYINYLAQHTTEKELSVLNKAFKGKM